MIINGIKRLRLILVFDNESQFKQSNAGLQLRAHSTHLRDIVAARQLQGFVGLRRGKISTSFSQG
jgi:hypothetical protein